ncbi:MAG: glycosyltransferase family 29 protein [Akkermansia sp.]|nr:glycosyltransferase family 29 protein [Akkermansia sp.]
MIHVLITVKESKRFPGKNRLLAPFSILWLVNEIAYMEEEVKVYTVGERTQLPLRLPVGWQHIRTEGESHQADIESAENLISPSPEDVMLLVQVTQPLREPGLIDKAVRAIREGADSCVSVTEQREDSWRTVQGAGHWGNKTGQKRHVVDGQIYAWKPGHVEKIFSPTASHALISSSQRWGYVDIDERSDIPPGLKAMAADLLLEPMKQPPLVIKNKKVLVIGSGKDIVGRGLGKRIDAGEWDVVVRCNHFYGDPVDVGTRTDLAVVREARFEKDFFNEAPKAPVRVLTTNDGTNFPKHLLQQAAQEVGHREASIGIIAARWLLNCGARLSVIGIGHFPDGTWISQKTYPDGTVDTAGFCDWNKENAWWMRQRGVELL